MFVGVGVYPGVYDGIGWHAVCIEILTERGGSFFGVFGPGGVYGGRDMNFEGFFGGVAVGHVFWYAAEVADVEVGVAVVPPHMGRAWHDRFG